MSNGIIRKLLRGKTNQWLLFGDVISYLFDRVRSSDSAELSTTKRISTRNLNPTNLYFVMKETKSIE